MSNNSNTVISNGLKAVLEGNKKVTCKTYELNKLKSDFPQYFDKDGKFDFFKFKDSLEQQEIEYSEESFSVKENYSLNFVGKKFAQIQCGIDTTTVITPDVEHNNKEENKNSENIYIKGDNLDAIKHLLKSYKGMVKCIYIDPPYNTGSDDFAYPDNFKYDKETLKKMGLDDEEAERVEKLYGKSTHSAWLTFMLPRLLLARNLLSNDGIIYISIDDNEANNLKLLCDGDIFGEENFVAQMIWQQGRKSTGKKIATNHEYCLIYAKNLQYILDMNKSDFDDEIIYWKEKKQCLELVYKKEQELYKQYNDDFETMSKEMKKYYKSFDEAHPIQSISQYCNFDTNGIYFAADASAPDKPESRSHRPLIHPITKKETAVPSKGWRFKDETLDKLVADNRIHFGKDETKIPNVKRYLRETEYELAQSVFYKDNRGASQRLTNLFGFKVFDNPKDENIIKKFIKYCVLNKDSKDIILDFFSGSATTAQAVMQINADENNGNCRFILVQIPEPTYKVDKKGIEIPKDGLKEAYKHGYKTICDIGIDRIKKSAKQIKKETKADIDYGFKIYELNKPKEDTLDKIESFDETAIKFVADDFRSYFSFNGLNGEDTILQTWKVQDGYGFTATHEEINLDECLAYKVEKTLYLINPSESDFVKPLIEKFEKELSKINKIIVFGYSYTFTQMQSLDVNIKNYNDAIKGIKTEIVVEVRY